MGELLLAWLIDVCLAFRYKCIFSGFEAVVMSNLNLITGRKALFLLKKLLLLKNLKEYHWCAWMERDGDGLKASINGAFVEV